MAKNMGTMDRGLCIAIALVLLIAAFGWAPLSHFGLPPPVHQQGHRSYHTASPSP